MLSQAVTPYLVDLAAWANFTSLGFDAELGINRCNTSANSLNTGGLRVLKSSRFFQELADIRSGPVFELLLNITEREYLLAGSKARPESGISTLDAVGFCPVLQAFADIDSAKMYSLIQYLELLFYIEEVVQRQKGARTIKLILPNDEYKFYPDLALLEIDMARFLKLRLGCQDDLRIELLCFKYGSRASNRPYLNTTKGLMDSDVSLLPADVVQNDQEGPNYV